MEIWNTIEGYPNYEVSNLGNVRSLNYLGHNKTELLKQTTNTHGYKTVALFKDGKVKRCFIHRLVAQAFIDNPQNLPQINHKDEDKTNNCVTNLEWCTRSYNINYGTRNERVSQKLSKNPPKPMLGRLGKDNPLSKQIYQYTKDGTLVKIWNCITDVERELGFHHNNISSCSLGKINSAYGYKWKYN